MTQEREISEDDRLHYEVLVGDIRESKANQWRASNLALIAQAAVATAFRNIANCPFDWRHFVYIIIATAISIMAIYVICEDCQRIKNCREETNKEIYCTPYNHQKERRKPNDEGILTLFFSAQIVGWVVAIMYVFWL